MPATNKKKAEGEIPCGSEDRQGVYWKPAGSVGSAQCPLVANSASITYFQSPTRMADAFPPFTTFIGTSVRALYASPAMRVGAMHESHKSLSAPRQRNQTPLAHSVSNS